MSEFQKEIGVVIVLLAFFCVFSVYAEIVRTEKKTLQSRTVSTNDSGRVYSDFPAF